MTLVRIIDNLTNDFFILRNLQDINSKPNAKIALLISNLESLLKKISKCDLSSQNVAPNQDSIKLNISHLEEEIAKNLNYLNEIKELQNQKILKLFNHLEDNLNMLKELLVQPIEIPIADLKLFNTRIYELKDGVY